MRLAFRLAGSCSIPWRVDAERADLRLGRRGISIWVDGRRWRGVGAVVQRLAAALSVTRQVVGNSRSGQAVGSRTFLETDFHFRL